MLREITSSLHLPNMISSNLRDKGLRHSIITQIVVLLSMDKLNISKLKEDLNRVTNIHQTLQGLSRIREARKVILQPIIKPYLHQRKTKTTKVESQDLSHLLVLP